ncbi:MAG: amidohydrolase family protein, partial [Oscillospiraceae bacterium]|nr:amidohydrolase family protein [Oscillospiraceae bacterium]
MKTLFYGGGVVSGQGVRRLDVLAEDGKIRDAAEGIRVPDAERVDCTGKLLFPGFIDGHTHFDLEVGGTITADDFATGSRAALRGGTTMVVDFAAPDKGETLASGLERWREKSEGRSACDYGFHMTIDDWNEGISREIGEMMDQGISSFKMYMTYPAMMLPEGDMYRALLRLKEVGGIAGVHCENDGVIRALVREARAAGRMAPASHPRTRPAPLEAEAVSHLL